ncbi:DNA-binding PadR family transcriptional regulator [Nakamurella sp. UYEF19]|uniref:PadR family transcriptional regulator n=1 Tax=Nakamurella sp. UYEF19 TaxID=1756392 RepID=UPI003398D955
MVDRLPRLTHSTQAVLRAMVENPMALKYGLEVGAATGLPSGTIHPILARLENLGWVESDWEAIDPKIQGRPRRRYYRISDDGLSAARQALAQADAATSRIRTRLRPSPEPT